MLKKAILGAVILMGLVSGAWAGNYIIPSGFYLQKNSYGAKLYTNSSINMSVVVLDVDKGDFSLNGYDYSDLISNYNRDVLVGLHPSVNVGNKKWYPIGRNYIGGIPRSSCNPDYLNCQYKYLLYFIGKGFSQPNFLSRIKYWGVKERSIVMMDGSSSAQLKSGSTELYGYQYPGISYGTERKIPNIITIKKW